MHTHAHTCPLGLVGPSGLCLALVPSTPTLQPCLSGPGPDAPASLSFSQPEGTPWFHRRKSPLPVSPRFRSSPAPLLLWTLLWAEASLEQNPERFTKSSVVAFCFAFAIYLPPLRKRGGMLPERGRWGTGRGGEDFLISQRVTGSTECLLNQTMSFQGKESDGDQRSLIWSWIIFKKESNYGSHTDIKWACVKDFL